MVDYLKDFAYCKLTAGITAVDTTLPVDDSSRLPSNAILSKSDFYLTIESTFLLGLFEIVKVTAKTSTTLTVLRGQDGSTAAAHSSGDYLKGSLSANQFRRARADYNGTGYPDGDPDLYITGDHYIDLSTLIPYVAIGVSATDAFNRPDTTTKLGLPWFAQSYSGSPSVFGITSGRAKVITFPTGQTAAQAKVDAGSTTIDISMDYYYVDGASATLIARSVDQNASDEFWFTLTASGGTTINTHTGAGTATNATVLVTGTSVASLVTGTKYTMRFTVSATTLTAYVNGTQVATVTSAANGTGTFVGFQLRSSNDTVDSFTIAGTSKFLYWGLDNVDSSARAMLGQMAVQMDDMLDILQLNDVAIGTVTAQALQIAATLDDLIDIQIRDESTLDSHGQQLLAIATAFDDLLENYQAMQPLCQPQGTLLRKYDFSDGTVSSFTASNGTLSNVLSRLQVTDGSQRDKEILESSGVTAISDGEVVADLISVSGNAAAFLYGGVLFRATDASNLYNVQVALGTPTGSDTLVNLYKKVAGTYSIVSRSSGLVPTFSKDALPIRMFVRFVGSLIQVFVNEVLVLAYTDTTYTTGRVGVYAYNQATVQFDNVAAYSLPSTWAPVAYA